MKLKTVLYVAVALFSFSSPLAAAPKLSHTETSLSFGAVRQGIRVERTFELVNVGDAPVHIDRLEPSINNLTVSLSQSTLGVAERATLRLAYDSRYGMGPVEPSVALFSNCSEASRMVFRLKGFVMYSASSTQIPLDFDPRSPMLESPVRLFQAAWRTISRFIGIP